MADAPRPDEHSTAQPTKRRAACDECRSKKLKCTGVLGQPPRCGRCEREDLACVFSAQKQMGRPKKRQKDDEGNRMATKRRSRVTVPSLDTGPIMPDMDNYESAFTPGGSLQPWLREGWPTEFSGEGGHKGHETDGGVPSLSPDAGMQSSCSSSIGNSHSAGGSNVNYGSTALLLDPVLTGLPDAVHPMPNCACLSTMYLTLNTLQGMEHDSLSFPFSLHPLREAMQTVAAALKCEECPTRFISGMQNVQLLGTLLICIAERCSKVLEHLNSEAERAGIAGETKRFRLADLNTSTSHLHTGGLHCAATFSIDLRPTEWKAMCKRILRAEVHGPEDGNTCCPSFVGLCEQMEERQNRWHMQSTPEKLFRTDHGSALSRARDTINNRQGKGEHLCLKLVGFAKTLVATLDWS